MRKLIQTFTCLAALAVTHLAMAAPVALEITGDDTMRFNIGTLEAKAGEEVELTFKNLGKLPKAAMGHNVVVLQKGTDVPAFANAAVMAAGNDYIPTGEVPASQIVAHTKLLGPGESDTITFKFDEPGTYPFICSFPGHWALMKGTFEVK